MTGRYWFVALPPTVSLDYMLRVALALGYNPADVGVDEYLSNLRLTAPSGTTPSPRMPILEWVDSAPVPITVGLKVVGGHGSAEDDDGEPAAAGEEGEPATASSGTGTAPETDTPGPRPADVDELPAVCADCGRRFQSVQGRAVHWARTHGPNSVTNREKQRETQQAEIKEAASTLAATRLSAIPDPDDAGGDLPDPTWPAGEWPKGAPMVGCTECPAYAATATRLHEHTLTVHKRAIRAAERMPLGDAAMADRLDDEGPRL